MNYLKQLQAFRDQQLFKAIPLSSGQIALYYALLQINNKSSWTEWFTVANSTLATLSGLSRSGISKARNVLKQYQLIDFKSNGKKATSYKVCILYTSDSTQGREHSSTQGWIQDREHTSVQDSTTLVKHKQNIKINETKQDHQDNVETPRDVYNQNTDFKELITYFQQNIGVTSPILVQQLRESVTEFTKKGTSESEAIEIVKYAIRLTVENGARRWNYTNKILMNWINANLFTLENIKASNKLRNKHDGSGDQNNDFMERSNLSAKETGLGF